MQNQNEERLDYYNSTFTEIVQLGGGAFGTVYKANSKLDNNVFAIKKVPIKRKESISSIKESAILKSLSHIYVVKTFDCWVEPNYYLNWTSENASKHNLDFGNCVFDSNFTFLLHIQMELCDATLRDIISQFNYYGQNYITENNYAIASEILLQLMEALNYLHQHEPPIIHRDIKPENVLIIRSQKRIKLADFGLASYHEFSDQTHTKYVGTRQYIAPELMNNKYDLKCDLYSVGMIIRELFNLDFNRNFIEFNPILDNKYLSIMNIALKCLSIMWHLRPSCEFIINNKDDWFIKLLNFDEFIKEIHSNVNVVNQTTIHTHTLEQNKYRKVNIDKVLYRNYEMKFKDSCILGSGSFGQVWKAVDINENKEYAVKKIKIKTDNFDKLDKYVKREVDILKELDETFVVKYVDSWIDKNYYIDEEQSNFEFLMHIQMELCLFTLEDITFKLINPNQLNKGKVSAIKNSRKLFETIYDENTNLLNFVGYYIMSEILGEIIECVNYLHNRYPEVIHRDLKPSNILITFSGSKRFVKLADFGLATLQEFADQKHTYPLQASYPCPERNRGNYNAMSDIYVLHFVIQEMFNTDLNSEINSNSPLLNKYVQLHTLIDGMSQQMIKNRPKCAEILDTKNIWGLSYEESCNDSIFKAILLEPAINIDPINIENFIQFFIRIKSDITK